MHEIKGNPPAINFKSDSGDLYVSLNGTIVVKPASDLHLDCLYPKKNGNPRWVREKPRGFEINKS